MSQLAPDSELLSQGIVSIKGMTIRQAMFRLANAIAIVKPPVRSWNWVADWMQNQGVISERGGPVRGTTLKLYWQEVKKAGLVDDEAAKKTRERLKAGLLSNESIEDLLKKSLRQAGATLFISPLALALRQEAMPEKPKEQIPPRSIAQHSHAPKRSEPSSFDFESIRSAILENLQKPDAQRKEALKVGGKMTFISVDVQARVRSGEIADLTGFLKAMR